MQETSESDSLYREGYVEQIETLMGERLPHVYLVT